MFRNRMPRYEVLSEQAMATLDGGWRRLMTEIGVEFMDPRALLAVPRRRPAGRGQPLFLDPDFVLEQVARALSEFEVQARNPETLIDIGGDAMAFGAVYGPPFVREGRGPPRRDDGGLPQLHQARPVVPGDGLRGRDHLRSDTPLDSLDLDMTYALQSLTDKVYMGNVVSGVNAADTLAMTFILFGSREAIEETPATISLINCNSPLRWDDRMLEAQFEYSAAGQPVATSI